MTTGTEDYAYGNQCVSNVLNNYFTNVGINLAAKISKPEQCNFNIPSLIQSNIDSIFIQPIAEDEIRMHIRGGPDATMALRSPQREVFLWP